MTGEPFDATREDLGGGLTRRRPMPGEVDYALRRDIWIYETTLRLSMPVDASAPDFADAEACVRTNFTDAISKAASRMWFGGRPR